MILKICLKLRSPSPAKQAPGAGRGSCTPSAAVPPVPRHNLLLHPRENAAPDVWWARAGSNRCLSVATASPTWSKQETATARLLLQEKVRSNISWCPAHGYRGQADAVGSLAACWQSPRAAAKANPSTLHAFLPHFFRLRFNDVSL